MAEAERVVVAEESESTAGEAVSAVITGGGFGPVALKLFPVAGTLGAIKDDGRTSSPLSDREQSASATGQVGDPVVSIGVGGA